MSRPPIHGARASRWHGLALETACRLRAELRRRGVTEFRVAVNLSSGALPDPATIGAIRAALVTWEVPPGDLEIEVTGATAPLDLGGRPSILRELAELGGRGALDDFGTGYSSLGYLRHLPVDTLKIDRAFIRGLDHSREGEAIVGAVTALAHGLGLEVVAEGIETAGQAWCLREMGCDLGQGFHCSTALPEEVLLDLLSGRADREAS